MTLRLRGSQRDALTRSHVGNRLADLLRPLARAAYYEPEQGRVHVVGQRDQRHQIELDAQGNLLQLVSPLGRVTRHHYENGRMVAAQLPGGLVVRTHYDTHGRVAACERNDGQRHELGYDAHGRLASMRGPDGATLSLKHGPGGVERVVERDGGTLSRESDANGRLTRVVDALGRATRIEYDEAGVPAVVRHPDGTLQACARGGPATREFVDGAPYGEAVSDEQGRLLSASFADGQQVVLSYDARGNLSAAASDDASLGFEYDAFGRLVAETQNGRVVRYGYDADGQLCAITLPDGKTLGFSYDADGRLSGARDALGNEQRFQHGAGQAPLHRALPNGLVESYQRDLAERVTTIQLHDRQQVFWQQTYRRDAAGRVVQRVDSRLGAQAFRYDACGRLLEVRDAITHTVLEGFRYDAASQCIQGPLGARTFDARCRTLSSGATRYAYDAVGNRSQSRDALQSTRFVWAGNHALRELEGGPAGKAAYTYDALGRRLSKRIGSTTITFVWAGHQLVQELHEGPEGAHSVEYLYVPGTHQPLAKTERGAAYYYHCDHPRYPRSF